MKIDKNTFGVASMLVGLTMTVVGACFLDPVTESSDDDKKRDTKSAYDPKEYEKTRKRNR